ncbi:MAG: DUF1559 domain-containing protein [Planctomycetota bacterium]|nr:DUF1559 domain-containing protein [Planctomycetota bacterium]
MLSTYGATIYRKAFSLVELIVVVAIIGVLVSLLLPAVQHARESARRMSCANNMHQLGIAMHAYHEAHKRLPPGWLISDQNTPGASLGNSPGWSWGAMLLPYVEQIPLEAGFVNLPLGISHDQNKVARTQPLAVFRCPSNSNRSIFSLVGTNRCGNAPLTDLASADYVGVTANSSRMVQIARCATLPWTNEDTVFVFNESTSLRDIADGVSQTFVVGERSCKSFPSAWAGSMPEGKHARERVLGLIDAPPQAAAVDESESIEFGSYHPAGAQFLLADGAVRLVTLEIDPALFRALGTRRGGEPVSEFFVGD